MSVNQVVLLGKLISKKEGKSVTRAVIETSFQSKDTVHTQHNFVVCFGEAAIKFNSIEIGKTIFVSGSMCKNENKISEVVVKHFEVPNQ